jgi:hypothetical protein
MNKTVFEHVKKYCESKGYDTDEESIIETIRDADEVWRDSGDRHRWYILYEIVVEINGMLIGFIQAECTGDNDAEDQCPFDKDSIEEYVATEKVVKVYTPKK